MNPEIKAESTETSPVKERGAEKNTKVTIEHIISAKEILAGFVDKVVPLFIETAIEALSLPDGEGVEFAAIVLNDALKYDSVYPYDRFSHADDSMYKAVEKIRNRLTIEDIHR